MARCLTHYGLDNYIVSRPRPPFPLCPRLSFSFFSCRPWFIFLGFYTVSLLSALSHTVFVLQASLSVSLCLPHPLFALPLCPLTAQMLSALSSHPIDFCGLLTPPPSVSPAPLHPLLPLFVPFYHTHKHIDSHSFPPSISQLHVVTGG